MTGSKVSALKWSVRTLRRSRDANWLIAQNVTDKPLENSGSMKLLACGSDNNVYVFARARLTMDSTREGSGHHVRDVGFIERSLNLPKDLLDAHRWLLRLPYKVSIRIR